LAHLTRVEQTLIDSGFSVDRFYRGGGEVVSLFDGR
jgi:hypothetical protein